MNRQRVRNLLNSKPTNPSDPNYDPDNHWLSEAELEIARETNDFVGLRRRRKPKYVRKISVK